MPHIIVEHTKPMVNKINLLELKQKLHTCLASQDTVKLESIKSRSFSVDNVIIGSGKINNFLHISVLLLKGRSEELKAKMASDLYNIAEAYIDLDECKLSVDISELGLYKK